MFTAQVATASASASARAAALERGYHALDRFEVNQAFVIESHASDLATVSTELARQRRASQVRGKAKASDALARKRHAKKNAL